MPSNDSLVEAERIMRICNACRYCEGLCAVFPAMELHRSFTDGDLRHLANLCHACGACQSACQYARPHEFDVNVPSTLATLRNDSYEAYAWPTIMMPAFRRNAMWIALLLSVSVALFIAGFMAFSDPETLFAAGVEEGAFYRIMPHNVMVGLFGGAFLFALFAMTMSVRNFWRDKHAGQPSASLADIWQAMRDAAKLRYLDGGGGGCESGAEDTKDRRQLFHHLTFYGFLACLASTSVATAMHYLLGWEAPYSWYSAPVVLGTLGGVGITVGPAGLLRAKLKRDSILLDEERFGMDAAFIVTLMLVGATGLLLLFLRATPAMGLLLAIHLGFVFGFFLSMPYGKFMHGLYRYAALVHYARSMRLENIPATAQPSPMPAE